MKKLFGFLLVISVFTAKAQVLDDTTKIKNYINLNIIPNGNKAITATMLNKILLSQISVMGVNVFDSLFVDTAAKTLKVFKSGSLKYSMPLPSGSGTSDYNALNNKPKFKKINGNVITGDTSNIVISGGKPISSQSQVIDVTPSADSSKYQIQINGTISNAAGRPKTDSTIAVSSDFNLPNYISAIRGYQGKDTNKLVARGVYGINKYFTEPNVTILHVTSSVGKGDYSSNYKLAYANVLANSISKGTGNGRTLQSRFDFSNEQNYSGWSYSNWTADVTGKSPVNSADSSSGGITLHPTGYAQWLVDTTYNIIDATLYSPNPYTVTLTKNSSPFKIQNKTAGYSRTFDSTTTNFAKGDTFRVVISGADATLLAVHVMDTRQLSNVSWETVGKDGFNIDDMQRNINNLANCYGVVANTPVILFHDLCPADLLAGPKYNPPTVLASKLKKFWDTTRVKMGKLAIVFNMPYHFTAAMGGTATYQNFYDTLKMAAASSGVQFNAYGGQDFIASGGLYSDGIHLNDIGSQQAATGIESDFIAQASGGGVGGTVTNNTLVMGGGSNTIQNSPWTISGSNSNFSGTSPLGTQIKLTNSTNVNSGDYLLSFCGGNSMGNPLLNNTDGFQAGYDMSFLSEVGNINFYTSGNKNMWLGIEGDLHTAHNLRVGNYITSVPTQSSTNKYLLGDNDGLHRNDFSLLDQPGTNQVRIVGSDVNSISLRTYNTGNGLYQDQGIAGSNGTAAYGARYANAAFWRSPAKIIVDALSDNYEVMTNSVPRIVVNQAGNVGINTVSPSYNLDVNGTARISSVPNGATGDSVLVLKSGTGGGIGKIALPSSSSPAEGDYAPTTSNLVNASAVTFGNFHYARNGNTVNYYGSVDVTPNGSGLTEFNFTLPISSSFSLMDQVSGTAANGLGVSAYINGTTSTHTAQMVFTAASSTSVTLFLHGSYEVL